ncbi:regulatory protein RecX [Microscilla marina]|uniref:Regulatory protein RecX n=1 Tax=Microscilla marina ATCC 23134 TaxID=313606 RepID=A1ZUG0_MICM2|nr:regulatory protein RecX [Microscilla marina]EAY25979.1 regulatory protein RecX [Microscilla marina ATCC 23134]
MTRKEAFTKICNFCAYQERAQQEVRDKLYSFGLSQDDVENLICDLIEENFINEERFAKIFAGSKFRVKKWGRVKIKQALKLKQISDYCIRSGMKEIEEEDYQQTLEGILTKKYPGVTGANDYVRKQKLARYAIARGFEPVLVWSKIKEVL